MMWEVPIPLFKGNLSQYLRRQVGLRADYAIQPCYFGDSF